MVTTSYSDVLDWTNVYVLVHRKPCGILRVMYPKAHILQNN